MHFPLKIDNFSQSVVKSNIGAKLKNTAPNLFGAAFVFNKAIGCRNRQPYFLYFPVFLKCLRIRRYRMRL